ncbi:hypothetical protein EDB84DRAFT_1442857 [Lactarius hengduanensis]|nr:hypothetical protein EDB84DRAFT_1442857 [Lactarius hengduanensis]
MGTRTQDGNDSINESTTTNATCPRWRRRFNHGNAGLPDGGVKTTRLAAITIATAGQPVNFIKDSDDMPTPNDNNDNLEATDDDDSEATDDDDSDDDSNASDGNLGATDDNSDATDNNSDVTDDNSDATDDNSDATDDNTDATDGDNSDATDNAQRRRGAVTTRMGQASY